MTESLALAKHEEKYCPCCSASFECKVGNIGQCQCFHILLTEEETKYIRAKFTDCLCAACISLFRTEYNIAQNKSKMKELLTGR